MKKRVLIIEDDPDIVEVVRTTLETEGYAVSAEQNGQAGLEHLRDNRPDLLLLDLTLPQQSGLEICKQIRRDERLNHLPVIMLTARAEVSDLVLGLEVGADDYITKPFENTELLARIKALMRRIEPSDTGDSPLTVGSLSIDPASYRVQKGGQALTMSTLEFKLLYYFASHPGKVYSRDQLLDAVWGPEHFVTPRIVDVYIRSLREKIEENPSKPVLIRTQRGAGYMFEVNES